MGLPVGINASVRFEARYGTKLTGCSWPTAAKHPNS